MNGYQVDASAQFFTASIAAAVGGGLCFVYDLMRLVRYIKRPSALGAFFQDMLWWLVATVATYLLLLVRCSGVVRFFALFGLALGFVCWRMTVSILFMRVMCPAVDAVVRVINAINERVFSPVCALWMRIAKKCLRNLKNILISVKNLLKHTCAVVYNQLKSWVGMPCRKRSDENGPP